MEIQRNGSWKELGGEGEIPSGETQCEGDPERGRPSERETQTQGDPHTEIVAEELKGGRFWSCVTHT